MSVVSVGEFVKSKMHNMADWVQAELGSAAPIDCVAIIHARSELELTTLCVMLNSEKDIAARRDWDAFVVHSSSLRMKKLCSHRSCASSPRCASASTCTRSFGSMCSCLSTWSMSD